MKRDDVPRRRVKHWPLRCTRLVVLHQCMAHYASALLPSGTTAKEALYAELNALFRQHYKPHLTTLRLKLDFFTLAKQVAPLSYQETQHEVLSFTLARTLLCREQWPTWCFDGQTTGPARKAKLDGVCL